MAASGTQTRPKRPSLWTPDEVAAWVAGHAEVQQYAAAFAENELSGEDVLQLSSADVKDELGVKKMKDRKRILELIQELAEEEEAASDARVGVQMVEWSKHRQPGKAYRSFMVVGETGTGKTTLINSMMNYAHGVRFRDSFRYKLISDEGKESQAESQTDQVTTYYIDAPALNYGLAVIDTPGFGDTRGVEQDAEIVRQIKAALTDDIQDINAICFVMQASQPRLTKTQVYVFQQMMSVFARDIKESIVFLLTFADATAPPALAAIDKADIPHEAYFKLNNSAFFLDSRTGGAQDRRMAQMFWDMGMESFRAFFTRLERMPAQSLTLTKQVLSEREKLELAVINLHPNIKIGLSMLDNIRRQIHFIKQHREDVNENKDFMVPESNLELRRTPTSNYTTTCLTCDYTCHRNCGIQSNDKSGCWAMDSSGNCEQCPKHCHWMRHKNLPYFCEWVSVTTMVPLASMKARFVDASSKMSTAEQVVDGLLRKFQRQQAAVVKMIDTVRLAINRLNEIALCPNVMQSEDYFNLMIKTEQQGRKAGWEGRVEALERMRDTHKTMSAIHDPSYDPWSAFADVRTELVSAGRVGAQALEKKCLVM